MLTPIASAKPTEIVRLALGCFKYTCRDEHTSNQQSMGNGTDTKGNDTANYLFSVEMLRAMSEEYTHRYGKTHKCSLLLPFFRDCAKHIPHGYLSKHPQCFGKGNDHFKTSEIWPIQAYRNYYRWKYQTTEWCGKYKLREIPRWLKESMT